MISVPQAKVTASSSGPPALRSMVRAMSTYPTSGFTAFLSLTRGIPFLVNGTGGVPKMVKWKAHRASLSMLTAIYI